MNEPFVPIPPRFRVALAAKGLLLLSLAAVFLVLGFSSWGQEPWPLLVRLGAFGFAVLTARFLGWAAGLALLDAIQGKAERSSGAMPLPSRRSGRSLRLPSGRFVEYLLVNSWQPLEQGARYTVTYGRRSGVLVAPPEREVG